MGPAPQGESYERGNVFAPKEFSSPVGRLDWTERELWSLGGEHSTHHLDCECGWGTWEAGAEGCG